MQRGPSSEPALEWKAIFSQLNAWGFSRASIELRLTLERMGSGLEASDARAKTKAEEDIQSFMTGLFSRDLHPEETDLTADVLRGITGAVATQVSQVPFPTRTAAHCWSSSSTTVLNAYPSCFKRLGASPSRWNPSDTSTSSQASFYDCSHLSSYPATPKRNGLQNGNHLPLRRVSSTALCGQ